MLNRAHEALSFLPWCSAVMEDFVFLYFWDTLEVSNIDVMHDI